MEKSNIAKMTKLISVKEIKTRDIILILCEKVIFLYLMCLILLVIKHIFSHLSETLTFATLSIFLYQREKYIHEQWFQIKR